MLLCVVLLAQLQSEPPVYTEFPDMIQVSAKVTLKGPPVDALLSFEAERQGLPFSSAHLFHVEQSGTLQFSFAIAPFAKFQNVQVRLRTRRSPQAAWNPPLASGQVVVLDDWLLTPVSDPATRKIHSMVVDAQLLKPQGWNCSPFALDERPLLARPSGNVLRVFTTVDGWPNQKVLITHMTWNCTSPSGQNTRMQGAAPRVQFLNSEFVLAEDPNRKILPGGEMVVAGAGGAAELPAEIQTTGIDWSLPHLVTMSPGELLLAADLVEPRLAEWNRIRTGLRIELPSTLPPGDYSLRAGGLSWKMRVTEAATEANRKRLRETAARELAADIASDPAVKRPVDTRPPDKPAVATFRAGVQLRKIRMVMLLDMSGSMNASQAIVPLRQAVMRFARQFLDGRNELAVVAFRYEAETVGSLSADWGEAGQLLDDALRKLKAQGGTNLLGALEAAEQEFRKAPADPEALDVVFLFTDGAPGSIHYQQWPCSNLPAPAQASAQGYLVDVMGFLYDLDRRRIQPRCEVKPWDDTIPFQQYATAIGNKKIAALYLTTGAAETAHIRKGIPNAPGLHVFAANPGELEERYVDVRREILRWASRPPN